MAQEKYTEARSIAALNLRPPDDYQKCRIKYHPVPYEKAWVISSKPESRKVMGEHQYIKDCA